MRLTRRQLRKLITEAIKSLVKTPNLTRRSLPHDVQFPPIPPEYDIDDPEEASMIQALRSAGAGRSADSLAAALSGGSENPFGHGGCYSDVKAAYDKIHDDEPYDDEGYLKPVYIEGVDLLTPEEVSTWFIELGHYLEFDKHPVHGDMHDTILYRLYADMHGRDLVRAITMLEDYLTNPKYSADRDKIDNQFDALQRVQLTLKDMKSQKDLHFRHYFER